MKLLFLLLIALLAIYGLCKIFLLMYKRARVHVKKQRREQEIKVREVLGRYFLYSPLHQDFFNRPREVVGLEVVILEEYIPIADYLPLVPLFIDFKEGTISAHIYCKDVREGSIVKVLPNNMVLVETRELVNIECKYVSVGTPHSGYKVKVTLVSKEGGIVEAQAEKA